MTTSSLLRPLGNSGLRVHPLCLGGNVFGWTADEAQSHAVLDAFVDGGGNFIDTADSYSFWVAGHVGGESETIIGRWLKARGHGDRVIVATKVGRLKGLEGLAPATIRTGIEHSLRRLQVDCIDRYYAHADDPGTPVSAAEFIHQRIAGSRLVVIPDSQHLFNIEQPAAFNAALTAFLTR